MILENDTFQEFSTNKPGHGSTHALEARHDPALLALLPGLWLGLAVTFEGHGFVSLPGLQRHTFSHDER